MDLSTTYMGIRLEHPIMPGAGPMADDLDLVRRLEDAGAPGLVMRSLFEEQVEEVAFPWGRPVDPDRVREALAARPAKALFFVHAETSTGVSQPIPPLRAVADELDAMLLADCVTSLAGTPVELDEWGVDAAYSGTQKCLSCPPGLAPVSFSKRAQEHLAGRSSKVQSWYLDLSMIASYWGSERVYHHTAPINMLYGLHEALRLALDEGLDARFRRHRANGEALWAGLEAMGLEPVVPREERLPQLTAVAVPAGVDEAAVRAHLLHEFGVEIGAGLGPMKGNTWRIGLMGAGSTRRNVTLCLSGLRAALEAQGYAVPADPEAAAAAAYA